ncbi:lipase family protein [Microbacterium sp. 10M-3C3]|uniref:lipase family protein n=1 Tax=Microbacterium sp. 10M-3C3 TaxID=2483401 RepID=UPI001F0BE925|nr:lipase family protein [Microbacterium sp. 10M-3C3]
MSTARRWSALPVLVARAPARVVLVVGIVVVVLGALIVTRPLTSLVLLAIYIGVSAVVTGVVELIPRGRRLRWWNRAVAAVWIVGGLAVLVWLGRSLDLLPQALAVFLVVGGLAAIGDALRRGRVSERVLAAASGVAQVAFAVLSLTWPDVTVLVVAIVFGVRTLVFGGSLVIRGAREWRAQVRERRGAPAAERTRDAAAVRVRTRWAAAGRYALAVVLVATAAGGWWLDDWLAEGAPVIDAFYSPPADLPEGHGRLIRWDVYQGRAPQNGDVYRVLYTTRDAVSRPAVASGLVIVPKHPPAGPRPVVVWNHGTTGVAQGCAPSLRDASATRWSIPALEDALKAGWVVVASDYSGQGAPGTFPYLIGKGEARSSLDIVLAAAELPDVTLSPDTVVWGHSQGGHAALWTTRLAPEYTPGIDVLGTAAIAPAAEPAALARELLRSDASALLSVLTSWVLVPYSETYADVHLEDYVTPGARSIVREMTQRCPTEPGVVVSVLTALGVSEDRPLYDADLTAGALGRRLEENSAVAPLGSPILLAWGRADEVIPTKLQGELVRELCSQGQTVKWRSYSGYTHLQPILPKSRFLPVLYRWTDALFERAPGELDDCGKE